MADKEEFWILVRASKGDAVVVLVTFLLVAFYDLTDGILAGFLIGTLLFLFRMAGAVRVDADVSDPDLTRIRIAGVFFFGAASAVTSVFDSLEMRPKGFVLDLSTVSMLDSTAAEVISDFARKVERSGAALTIFAAASIREALARQGVRPPSVLFVGPPETSKPTSLGSLAPSAEAAVD
jgi:SulP family sulfate permease